MQAARWRLASAAMGNPVATGMICFLRSRPGIFVISGTRLSMHEDIARLEACESVRISYIRSLARPAQAVPLHSGDC